MSLDLNSGALAPVSQEVTSGELKVSGVIPDEISGTLVRNGPNPFSGRFTGDGVTSWWPEAAMLHAIHLQAGQAQYRNRWVRTSAYHQHFGGDADTPALDSNPNVNVAVRAGEILALAEGAPAVAIDTEINTLGLSTSNALGWPGETAHPKYDPVSGEFVTFRADWAPPYLRYGVVDADAQALADTVLELTQPVMMHDMAITERHSILLDLGVGLDLDMLSRGHRMPLRWLPDKVCQLIILPRRGGAARTIEIEPCFIQHVVNAYDTGPDQLVMDAVRYPHYFLLDQAADQYKPHPLGTLWRFEIDLSTGQVTQAKLLNDYVELPRINEFHTGRSYRYGYMVVQPTDEEMRGLLRYDFDSGKTTQFSLPAGDQNSEPVFVPRSSRMAEDDGWILSVIYRAATDTSDLVVLDAADLSADPVATVHIPYRIPAGFHGTWLPG